MERLRELVASRTTFSAPLDAAAAAAIVRFLNEQLGERELLAMVLAHTALGREAKKKNAWSRGTWVPQRATLEGLNGERCFFRVTVQERGKAELTAPGVWKVPSARLEDSAHQPGPAAAPTHRRAPP